MKSLGPQLELLEEAGRGLLRSRLQLALGSLALVEKQILKILESLPDEICDIVRERDADADPPWEA